MGKYKDIDYFVDEILAKSETPEMSLNMYQLKWENEENANIAKIRRENLRFYLEKMKKLKPSYLFVGEAPGRWGCFQTGIPFTDIKILNEHQFFQERKKELSELDYVNNNFLHKKETESEITSSDIWEQLNILLQKGLKLPLLWNIYPFHPATKKTCNETSADKRKNGHPTSKECNIGIKILFDLLDCFNNIKKIYPIGKKASDTFQEKFLAVGNVLRHPSYGGSEEFRKQFNEIYQIKEITSKSKNKKDQNNKKNKKKD